MDEYSTLDPLKIRIATHRNYSEKSDDVEQAVVDVLDASPISSLLDMGCGTGSFLRRLADDGGWGRLVGLDASAAAVAEVKASGAAEAFEGTASRMPFANDSFDAVTARHMLYHVADPRAAVVEARRVLRSGGQFAASVNRASGLPRTTTLVREVISDLGGEPQDLAGWLTGDELPGLIAGVFGNVTTAHHDNALVFATPEPLIAFAGAILGIYGGPYDPVERVSFMREIDIRARSWFAANDEPWRDPKGYVVCRAQKRVGSGAGTGDPT
jgi:SAM-dependent methyltransferase